MLKKNKIFVFLLPLVLASCQTTSTASEDLTSVSLPPLSNSQSEVEPLYDGEGNILVDIFGINDFHGAIVNQETSDGLELGFSKIGAYLKAKEAENPYGTIITSSGDMWQGSADSNLTKGALVTELMNYIGFDAMALGNHEFDWTDEAIFANKELASFPFLGANIMEKATNTLSDLADAYTLVDLGAIQVGIIGTIGSSLESSILTSAVADYSFEPESQYVIAARNELEQQGADVFVLLTHDSWVTLDSEARAIINEGNEPYVDAVFCGHQHAGDRHLENGVPVLQTTGMGHELMHVRLAVNPETFETSVVDYNRINATTINAYNPDATLDQVYDYYYVNFIKDIKEEVLGSLKSEMAEDTLGVHTTKAMYKYAQTVEPEVALAVHNSGGVRAPLPKGTITYGDVYKSLPFDNYTAIVTIEGNDLAQQLSWNKFYPTDFVPQAGVEYRVISISYLLEKEAWSYVTSDTAYVEHPDGGYYYPRDMVAEAFRNNTF